MGVSMVVKIGKGEALEETGSDGEMQVMQDEAYARQRET